MIGVLETPRPLDGAPPNVTGRNRPLSNNISVNRAASKSSNTQRQAIKTISRDMKSRMITKFGSKESPTDPTSNSREKLITNTNKIIDNRNSILKAAMQVSAERANRLKEVIPTKSIRASRGKRSEVVNVMVSIWPVFYELLQHSNFLEGQEYRRLRPEIEVFIAILEEVERQCRVDVEKEKEKGVSDRFGKSLKLSALKMARQYLKGGGTLLQGRDRFGSNVTCCPKCLLKLFDKEPDYDANKAHNDELKRTWDKLRRQVMDFLGGTRSDPPVDAKGKAITTLEKLSNPQFKV